MSKGRSYEDYLKWRMIKGFRGLPASKEAFNVTKDYFDKLKVKKKKLFNK